MEVNEGSDFGKKWDLSLSDLNSMIKSGKATDSQIKEYDMRKKALIQKTREKNGGSTNE